MKLMPDLEELNQRLASWRGARAKMWLFHVTHLRLAICLSRPKEREAVYVIATGCRRMAGPFSWQSADISLTRQMSQQAKMSRIIVADRSASFELICDGVTVIRGAAFVPTNPFRGFSIEDIPRK